MRISAIVSSTVCNNADVIIKLLFDKVSVNLLVPIFLVLKTLVNKV